MGIVLRPRLNENEVELRAGMTVGRIVLKGAAGLQFEERMVEMKVALHQHSSVHEVSSRLGNAGWAYRLLRAEIHRRSGGDGRPMKKETKTGSASS